jgi:hypothetical protein
MSRNHLVRSVADLRRGTPAGRTPAIQPGWAMGPFYPMDELPFASDFEVKEWDAALVRKTWQDHALNGPEYISVTQGRLTIIFGERTCDTEPPAEIERVDVVAGSSVVLRPGVWRRFECTPDVTGISVRRPAPKT